MNKIEKYCCICRKEKSFVSKFSHYVCNNCKQSQEYLQKLKISRQKRELTCLKKYGTKNNFLAKDENGNFKRDKTCLKKYGVKSPLQNKRIHKKVKQTCLKKYGVDNPRKSQKIIHKIQSKRNMVEILKKCKKTLKERYGVEYTWHVPKWNPGYIDGRCLIHRKTFDGKKIFRGKFWKKISKEIIKRDNYKCKCCNVSQVELKQSGKRKLLQVHHINPWVDILIENNFDLEKTENIANCYENLETLCPKCHKTKEKELIRRRKKNGKSTGLADSPV